MRNSRPDTADAEALTLVVAKTKEIMSRLGKIGSSRPTALQCSTGGRALAQTWMGRMRGSLSEGISRWPSSWPSISREGKGSVGVEWTRI